MRISDFTTVELQRVARGVLRCYLEVQAGTRPAAALVPLLTPSAASDLPRLKAGNRPRVSLSHRDLGPVTVLRFGPDRAYAVAAVAPSGERPSTVLSVELVAQGKRVAAPRVGEVESQPSQDRPGETPSVGPSQPVPSPPVYMTGLLGHVPHDPHDMHRWAKAAVVIDTYRERYSIEDATSAFGPAPQDAEQRIERERALAYVRDIERQLGPKQPGERSLDQGRVEGPELGR